TGLKNLLDVAVVEYFEKTASGLPSYEAIGNGKDVGYGMTAAAVTFASRYLKLDEIPFDFVRRRMSVVLSDISDDKSILVSKGAVEEMLSICTKIVVPLSQNTDSIDIQMALDGASQPAIDVLDKIEPSQIQTLTPAMILQLIEMNKGLNVDGLRVVAVAYRNLDK
ncbi:hypothetical protein BGZ72_003963, partial [Mortierella alpina]